MDERPDLALRRKQVDTHLTITRIRHAVERRASALFAEHGLSDVTPAQSNVLLAVMHGRRPLTARQIAHQLGLSEVTVGRFVHALEGRGWVERRRHPEDRRAMLVLPTDKARRRLPKLIELANALLDEAFGGLDDRQMETLAALVEQVWQNLGPEPGDRDHGADAAVG